MFEALPKAIETRKPLVIGSGHAQGKDFFASCVSLWFLNNFYPSKVITTGPTDRQVKEIMWAEIEGRWNQATVKLPGRIMTCKIDVEPNWFMIGFTTKETGQMTGKFQGFHSPNLLVIVTEAQAVSDQIYEQLDGILTSKNSLLIMIGNPLRSSGRFAKYLKDTTNNISMNLSCLDSPNYIEKEEVIPGMASYEWVEDKRKRWGEDHPLWHSRVLGQLPKVAIDSVFYPDLVDRMVTQIPNVVQRRIVVSVDPARFGDDECVITGGVSGRVVKKTVLPMSSAPEVCSHTLQMVKLIGANHIIIDADGLGGPIADFLRKLKPNRVELQEVYGQGKPEDEEHYANNRTEIFFYAKDQAEKGYCSIDDDDYLKEELLEPTYEFNMRGRMQLEKKDDIKERLGRSTNRADSWVMNIWAQKSSAIVRTQDAWREDGEEEEDIGTAVKSAMAA